MKSVDLFMKAWKEASGLRRIRATPAKSQLQLPPNQDDREALTAFIRNHGLYTLQ